MNTNGILVANKPRGITSHDVVNAARRAYGTRAVGHAGTLDPMASGVLVLLFGEATKLAPFLTRDDKEYDCTVSFGRSTETLDAEGATVSEVALSDDWLDEALLARALSEERARTLQDPPEYSAISVAGERAYRRARRGEAVNLESRPVSVAKLELVRRGERSLGFELRVSKGYYVRAFARDLGGRLGSPSHLSELVRTASGPFRIERAARWPLESPPPDLVPLSDAARMVLPPATLAEAAVDRARTGRTLSAADFAERPPGSGISGWFAPDGSLVAVGRLDSDGLFRVVRGFRDGF